MYYSNDILIVAPFSIKLSACDFFIGLYIPYVLRMPEVLRGGNVSDSPTPRASSLAPRKLVWSGLIYEYVVYL